MVALRHGFNGPGFLGITAHGLPVGRLRAQFE